MDAISFLPKPVNVACHSLNILSTGINFIHLYVFWLTIRSQRRVSLFCRKGLWGKPINIFSQDFNFQFCQLFVVSFCGFFLMIRNFLYQATLSMTLFPFQSTCRLLPCPYYSTLMHFGQGCLLCIWKVLGPNLCASSIPSVLFPRLVSKTFLCMLWQRS